MSRPIPPKPEFIVKGNEGYMPQPGVWLYGAFHVNETTFIAATIEYKVDVRDDRPQSLNVTLYDAVATLIEAWGPDGELLPDRSKDDPMFRAILKKAVLDWFWAYDVHKVTKLELEALNR